MLFYLKRIRIFFIYCITYFALLTTAVHAGENSLPFPKIWNMTHENEYFIGREEVLEAIYRNFTNGNPFVALTGSIAIGKTQVAKKYVELHKGEYDIVWWIDTKKNIEEQFRKFAHEWNKMAVDARFRIDLSLSDAIVREQLLEQLRSKDLKYLLIFDNAYDEAAIEYLIPYNHNKKRYKHILVTSRNPFSWKNIIQIEKLARKDSVELILNITRLKDRGGAESLAETLLDHPLALVQASAYIRTHPTLTLIKYNQLFLSNRKELLKEETKIREKHIAFDHYESTLSTMLSSALGEIRQESSEAIELFMLCSFLHNKHIHEDFISAFMNHKNIPPLQQEYAISLLTRTSLIESSHLKSREKESFSKETVERRTNIVFSMNKMVQTVILENMTLKEKKKVVKDLAKMLAQLYPSQLNTLIPRMEDNPLLLLHLEEVIMHLEKEEIFNDDLLILYIRLLEHAIIGKRDYAAAHVLFEKIEKAKGHMKEILPTTNCRYHILKSDVCSWKERNHEKAIELLLKGLNFLSTVPHSAEERVMIYNKLAHNYIKQGNIDSALHYASLGEKIIIETEGLTGDDILYTNLAKIYLLKAEYTHALDYIKYALEKIEARNNSRLTYLMDFPAYELEVEILIGLKNYKKAKKKILKLYDAVNRKEDKNKQFYQGSNMIFLGYVLYLCDNGDYKNALETIRLGQELLKSHAKEKYSHYRLHALSHLFIGEIHEKNEAYLHAREEYKQAEKIIKNIYPNVHTKCEDTSRIYAALAILHTKLCDNVEAQKYFTLHKKIFGTDHIRSQNIAKALLNNGLKVSF